MRHEKLILIVDDDDAIRALLTTVLRRRGYPVDAARNGVEAMELLGTRQYALVILDLMMPRMNGYEVLEHLGRLPVMTRPFVLVLTAGLEQRKFDTNLVVGTIQKPFDIELLVDTVAGCLVAAEGAQLPPMPTAMPEDTN
ncbi:MAG TPA: response regulator [Thermoanaerobaculia bacterium]|jgi:CheY-like chemotaxis protein|nr:response regulator [Thermoanaerobaculia bacterium]